eukprot:TRINITY_DN441_c0_g1_i3.p1 TRINITY_DN441_c0_g1~~TRINITY_DN441_c0_g1_i3.p1  ORF type:complete len:229 (-),score=44.70 TRINITY_DN441_c0_g1_i3:64-696(-)
MSSSLDLTHLSANARLLMVNVATGWIAHWDPEFYNMHTRMDVALTIDHLYDIIISLLSQLECNPKEFFIPVVYYSDMFIRKHGIKHNQLFNLLLASTMLTAKFWGESVLVSNKKIAAVFRYRLSDLNVIERRFLAGIDFKFTLSKTDINNFLFDAAQLTPLPATSPLTCSSSLSYPPTTIVASSPLHVSTSHESTSGLYQSAFTAQPCLV